MDRAEPRRPAACRNGRFECQQCDLTQRGTHGEFVATVKHFALLSQEFGELALQEYASAFFSAANI
jgi:hypothetical protein